MLIGAMRSDVLTNSRLFIGFGPRRVLPDRRDRGGDGPRQDNDDCQEAQADGVPNQGFQEHGLCAEHVYLAARSGEVRGGLSPDSVRYVNPPRV